MPSCLSALAGVALAAARWGAVAHAQLADEVVLLQKVADAGGDEQLELPKLHCDLKSGCYYEDLPKPTTPPQFPDLAKMAADFADKMKKVKPPQMPDFGKLMQGLAAAQQNKAAQQLKEAQQNHKEAADFAKMTADFVDKLKKMKPPQMPDFGKIMQGLAAAQQNKAAQQNNKEAKVPDFAQMAKDFAKLLPAPGQPPKMPDLGKLVQSAQQPQKKEEKKEKKQAAPAAKMPDFAEMAKSLAKVLPPANQQQPFQMPDLSKLLPGMPKSPQSKDGQQAKMPDFAEMAKSFAKMMTPQASQQHKQQESFQVADILKMLQPAQHK